MNVSILIATHGGGEWARLARRRALPSATGQEANEIIVRHEPEGTLAQARNHAAEVATGEWLCFLDADDELAPGYLTALAPAMSPGRLLVPAVQYVYEDGKVSRPAIPNRGRWPDLNVGVVGTLVERDLFDYVGGFREFPSLEDYDLWLRCWSSGAKLVEVKAAVYRAHVRAGSRNADQGCYHQIRADVGLAAA